MQLWTHFEEKAVCVLIVIGGVREGGRIRSLQMATNHPLLNSKD